MIENNGEITDQCKQSVSVLHWIGERSRRSSSPFITFWQVLKNISWK